MPEPTAIHATFVLERTYPVSPSRVFAAFADPAQKRRWFVEDPNNEVQHYQLDFRPGGKEHARTRFGGDTPVAGFICDNETNYYVVRRDSRIVFSNAMRFGDHTFSAALVTVELLPAGGETTLILTHQGAFFEGADGPQMREGGWRSLLDKLNAELAS